MLNYNNLRKKQFVGSTQQVSSQKHFLGESKKSIDNRYVQHIFVRPHNKCNTTSQIHNILDLLDKGHLHNSTFVEEDLEDHIWK